MFVDRAAISVSGGDGGNGVTSFRREKYVPHGGPDGGDGGDGGSIWAVADRSLRTLLDFRYRREYKADRGSHGQGSDKHGRRGSDMVVSVPPGTVIREARTGILVADMLQHGQKELLARGGHGGKGNARFATSTRQSPRFAEKGEPGQSRSLELELKLLADVGLIGMPNVGKSTLISRISAARPKIADYPFTTLTPNLGLVRVPDGRSYVAADIPGLIVGAHKGQGLGHNFLRHVERTRVLLHLLDFSAFDRDPLSDLQAINNELRLFNPRLAELPQLVLAAKMDIPEARARYLELLPQLSGMGLEILPISSVDGSGLPELVGRVADRLQTAERSAVPAPAPEDELPLITPPSRAGFQVEHRPKEGYVVSGEKIERLAVMTDMDNIEAVERFQRVMIKMGVVKALHRLGAREGDNVRIGQVEFSYEP